MPACCCRCVRAAGGMPPSKGGPSSLRALTPFPAGTALPCGVAQDQTICSLISSAGAGQQRSPGQPPSAASHRAAPLACRRRPA
eukprot:1158187-Pelagomonas_calceolata.AAC.7